MPVLDAVQEEIPEDLLRDVAEGVAKLAKKREPERFTHATIVELRNRSLTRYNAIPSHYRIQGMKVDLDEHEKIVLAHFEAAVEVLNRLGVLDYKKLEPLMPDCFTASQEVVEDEQVTYGAAAPKK